MAAIPEPHNNLRAAIDAAHEARQGGTRAHLGASLLGHPCERWLWLSFRWAVVERFSGRMLRLFRRGQFEENTAVEDLRAAGLTVEYAQIDGGQRRVVFSAHVSGSMDGIVSGLSESKKRHVLEVKTHNDKSFGELVKHGVEKAKPQHWAQMQVYMLGEGLERALYYAVNKNDDSLHTERVRLDKEKAQALVVKGIRITQSDRMPQPLSTDPTWYQCKMCPVHDLCHGSRTTKEVNCRTCAHSTATDEGWHCARWDAPIPTKAQREGCRSHVLHPDLVPWRIVGGDEWNAEYESVGLNGEAGIDSREIVGC